MGELHDQVEQGRANQRAVQGVLGEGVAHGQGGGQGAWGDGAGVDAAGPVGGHPSGAAAEQALHGGRRDRGEQAHAVHAVLPQRRRLLRADAVQGFDGQRTEPVGDVVGVDGEDAAGGVDLAGGGGRDRDRRPDPHAHVDTQTGEGPYPQHLSQPPGMVPW